MELLRVSGCAAGSGARSGLASVSDGGLRIAGLPRVLRSDARTGSPRSRRTISRDGGLQLAVVPRMSAARWRTLAPAGNCRWHTVAALVVLVHSHAAMAAPGAAMLVTPGAALSVSAAAADVAAATGSAPVVADASYVWHLPRGFPTPAVPADNPMSAAKVALGRRLFFEPRISITGQYSCASCHAPTRAYTDGRAVALGATGQPLTHSAMSLVNVAYNISFGWTQPQLQSLESQMLEPLLNEHPVELGLAGREEAVCTLLAADPEYHAAFAQAFPPDTAEAVGRVTPLNATVTGTRIAADAGAAAGAGAETVVGGRSAAAEPVSFTNLVKAIAAFERTLVAGGSPFDRYVFGGEHDAMSAEAKRGMQLFYSPRAGCGTCHSGFNFNGNWRDSRGETGKPAFANNGVGDQLMRVPTLRNIAVTAPYMHDGRFATLEAVLDHYAGAAQQPLSDAKLRTFNLTADERADVIAFLQALTDAEFSGR